MDLLWVDPGHQKWWQTILTSIGRWRKSPSISNRPQLLIKGRGKWWSDRNKKEDFFWRGREGKERKKERKKGRKEEATGRDVIDVVFPSFLSPPLPYILPPLPDQSSKQRHSFPSSSSSPPPPHYSSSYGNPECVGNERKFLSSSSAAAARRTSTIWCMMFPPAHIRDNGGKWRRFTGVGLSKLSGRLWLKKKYRNDFIY